MISRVLNENTDVHAFVSNKTEESRLRTLQFFGLHVSVLMSPMFPALAYLFSQAPVRRARPTRNLGSEGYRCQSTPTGERQPQHLEPGAV